MNRVRNTLALLAAFTVLCLTGTALAGFQPKTPAIQIDLVAMWTYNGTVLRWQEIPETKGCTISRRSGKGEYTQLYAAGPEETYYLDISIPQKDDEYTYQVKAALGGKGVRTALSNEAVIKTWYDLYNTLLPPGKVKVTMGPYVPVITWDKVEGAVNYAVYRRNVPDGKPEPLGWVEDVSFTDYGAKPGKAYSYQVRSLKQDHASVMTVPVIIRVPETAPLPPAKVDAPPEAAMVFDGYVYQGYYQSYWWIMPLVVNQSIGRVITGFDITFLCEDNGEWVKQRDTGKMFYTQRYVMTLGPGESIFVPCAWLYGYKYVSRVSMAVTSITFADGTTVNIPRDEWVFFSQPTE